MRRSEDRRHACRLAAARAAPAVRSNSPLPSPWASVSISVGPSEPIVRAASGQAAILRTRAGAYANRPAGSIRTPRAARARSAMAPARARMVGSLPTTASSCSRPVEKARKPKTTGRVAIALASRSSSAGCTRTWRRYAATRRAVTEGVPSRIGAQRRWPPRWARTTTARPALPDVDRCGVSPRG